MPETLPPETHGLLRRAVLEHRVRERRKTFSPVLHVGVPGELELVVDHRQAGPIEHGLRADLVAACLRHTRGGSVEPLVWLTRTGDFVLEDPDAAWLSAARSAYGEAGLGLTMVVVTRRGWWDPRTDVGREWKRLRPR